MAMEVQKGSTRVYIDPNRCIANAKCTTAAPGIFVLDEETGVATIENANEATIEQLFAGARACPTQAIIVEQFGKRIYPTILAPMFGESNKESEEVDEAE
jgi:ferredoxin